MLGKDLVQVLIHLLICMPPTLPLSWLPLFLTLESENIQLLPLTAALIDSIVAAGADERIWTYFPVNLCDRQKHADYLHKMLESMSVPVCMPFAVKEIWSGRTIGFTRLFNLNPANRQCEIGSWLHPDYWSTGMNREVKNLLLGYCFDTLKTIRVQFRTDTRNVRSRKALEKLGAVYEGVVRCERILENGATRDAAFYSILESEWAQIRLKTGSKSNTMTFSPEPVIYPQVSFWT